MNSQELWEKEGVHFCAICGKKEKCKGENCDFINMFGWHSSCYAERELAKHSSESSVQK